MGRKAKLNKKQTTRRQITQGIKIYVKKILIGVSRETWVYIVHNTWTGCLV